MPNIGQKDRGKEISGKAPDNIWQKKSPSDKGTFFIIKELIMHPTERV
jgi:hypothetical protein